MATKSLSAADICMIIKSCRENSVTEISLPEIAIKFRGHSNDLALTPGQESDFAPANVSQISPETQKQADEVDRALAMDAEQSQMIIDDPRAYEQSLIDQDVERSRELN